MRLETIHDLWKAIAAGKKRTHATGFAQMYLTPDVRLHVWSDDLFALAPDVTQIAFFHDHRYGIESHVLRGALLDSPVVSSNPVVGGKWAMYEVRPAHEGDAEKPMFAGTTHNIVLDVPRVIRADGDYRYWISRRDFHATRHIEPTVTVMRKDKEENNWARLLVPLGFDPVHSLIRQPDQNTLALLMWREAAKIGQTGLDRINEMLEKAERAKRAAA